MRVSKLTLILILILALPIILYGHGIETLQQENSTHQKLVTKVIKIKYADAEKLREILYPFLTRGYPTMVIANDYYNSIVITDFPQKIALIEEAIKQFDVEPIEVEFTFHLLEASDIPTPPATPVPPSEKTLPTDILPIINKLKSNFSYKTYTLLDTAFVRSSDSYSTRVRLGGLSKHNYPVYMEWSLLTPDFSTIKISRLSIYKDFPDDDRAKILSTSLMLEDGKPVVVGTSKPAADGKALITIIKAHIIKE